MKNKKKTKPVTMNFVKGEERKRRLENGINMPPNRTFSDKRFSEKYKYKDWDYPT